MTVGTSNSPYKFLTGSEPEIEDFSMIQETLERFSGLILNALNCQANHNLLLCLISTMPYGMII